jgi:HIRAN domain
MTRAEFLKKIFNTGLLVSVPPAVILSAVEQEQYTWTEDATPVFMYKAHIRGFQYYDGPKYLNQIKPKEQLDLVREHDNEHDEFATAVYWETRKLGYLPREDNLIMANLLDQGILLRCTAEEVHPDKEPWEACSVVVELLVPKNINFEKYLLEFQQMKKKNKITS